MLALIILLPLFSSVAEASTTGAVKKTQATTTLRVSASPKAGIVTSLPKGSLIIQQSTVKGGWSYVQTNTHKGYVATSALTMPSSKTKMVGSKSGLVIKETRTTKAKTIATLKQNMIVEDFGSVGSGWSLVQYGNVTGYVDSKLITATKPTKKYTNASVTLRNIASTNGKKTGTLDKNKEVSVHSQASNWSYITSGSLKGYVPSNQLVVKKPTVSPQTLNSFTNLSPTKIKWMKYYFDGEVLQGNMKSKFYGNYSYVVPSISMTFSPKRLQLGAPESDFIWTDIPAPLVQNKATPIYSFNWDTQKDEHIGNAYLRTNNGTLKTPAGTFKNVVHIEEKYHTLSYSIHYYFAPGYGLIKINDSKNRLTFELRSYK